VAYLISEAAPLGEGVSTEDRSDLVVKVAPTFPAKFDGRLLQSVQIPVDFGLGSPNVECLKSRGLILNGADSITIVFYL
jgi:hypothetical protein